MGTRQLNVGYCDYHLINKRYMFQVESNDNEVITADSKTSKILILDILEFFRRNELRDWYEDRYFIRTYRGHHLMLSNFGKLSNRCKIAVKAGSNNVGNILLEFVEMIIDGEENIEFLGDVYTEMREGIKLYFTLLEIIDMFTNHKLNNVDVHSQSKWYMKNVTTIISTLYTKFKSIQMKVSWAHKHLDIWDINRIEAYFLSPVFNHYTFTDYAYSLLDI